MRRSRGADSATERIVRMTRSHVGGKSGKPVTGDLLTDEDVVQLLEEQEHVFSENQVLTGSEASNQYLQEIGQGVSVLVEVGDADLFSFPGLEDVYDDSLGCEVALRRYARSVDEISANGREVASYGMYVPDF